MSHPIITHAIFDLDGTLLDTEQLYSDAASAVCKRHGAVYTDEIKRRVMGGDTMAGARYVVETLALPLEPAHYVAEREVELHALLARVAPMPGAIVLLELLRKRKIPIAVATSGHRAVTLRKLENQPFLQQLDALVCGDDARLKQPKPAPDIYLLAASELGADPRTCLVVEDSVNGLRAGLAAGMHTIALVDPRWGFHRAMFSEAAHVVDSLADLTLEQLGLG